MTYDVFISYSSPDRQIAERICATLEAAGIRCWIAPRDVPSASHYSGEIIRGLNQCRAVILVLSASSNLSWHVLREIERAVSKKKHILPVRLQDLSLSDDLEYFISVVHWFDAFAGIESKLQELEEAVRECLKGGHMKLGARLAEAPPTPHGQMEAFARSWCRTLSSLCETGAISDEEYSSVVREVVGSDWTVTEKAAELISLLVTDPNARKRALIDGSDDEIAAKMLGASASASTQRILYSIKTGLPLVCEELGLRFNLIPPGITAGALRHPRPIYLCESLVSESDWNRIMNCEGDASANSGRAKDSLSLGEIREFLDAANSEIKGRRMRVPTSDEWRFAVLTGGSGHGERKTESLLRLTPRSSFGLYDLLWVAWQFCQNGENYELRGGAWNTHGERSLGFEPPPQPCHEWLAGPGQAFRPALDIINQEPYPKQNYE